MMVRNARRMALLLAVLISAPQPGNVLSKAPQHLFEKELQLRQQLSSVDSSGKGAEDRFQALFELANTLQQLDYHSPDGGTRVPEAVRLYGQALMVSPNDMASMYVQGALGGLMLSAGRLDASLEALEAALKLGKRLGLEKSRVFLGTTFNKVKALQQMPGRETEAEALIQQLVGKSWGVAPDTYTKSLASLRSHSDSQVEEMREAADFLDRGRGEGTGGGVRSRSRQEVDKWGWLEKVPTLEHSWLYYALFSALDKRREVAPAWRQLTTANKLQGLGRDPQEGQQVFDRDQQMLRGLKQMFKPPVPHPRTEADIFYARLLAGEAGYPSPTPIFIVGMPRSGSTLVEQILDSHPMVWGAGEDTAMAPLIPHLTALLTPKNGMLDAPKVAAIGKRYVDDMEHRAAVHKPGARWVVDKMLRNAWNIGFIAFMLPRACIIHTDRHPAATAFSCYAQPFEGRGAIWATDLEEIAKEVQALNSLMHLWDSVLPRRVLRVRYEELVRDQEGVSRKILAHCGVPWDPAVLEFHRNERRVSTASTAQVRQTMYTSSVDRWRAYAPHIAHLLRPLRRQILEYERDAGLASSAELLQQVLGDETGEAMTESDERDGPLKDEL